MIATGTNLLISQSKIKEKNNNYERENLNPLARPQKVFSSVSPNAESCFVICVRKVMIIHIWFITIYPK